MVMVPALLVPAGIRRDNKRSMHRSSFGAPALLFAVGILLAVFLLRDGMVGSPAPPFSLHEVYGGQVDLASYRGQPVLLVFWATSCGICRYELPKLDRLAMEYQNRGLVMLAINVGDADGARDFMRERHISRITNLVDADGAIAQKYGVHGVPRLVLVGRDGAVERAAVGMQSDRTLRSWLESATGS
jgi:peroxiredoxin